MKETSPITIPKTLPKNYVVVYSPSIGKYATITPDNLNIIPRLLNKTDGQIIKGRGFTKLFNDFFESSPELLNKLSEEGYKFYPMPPKFLPDWQKGGERRFGKVQTYNPETNTTNEEVASYTNEQLKKGNQLHEAGKNTKIYDTQDHRTTLVPTEDLEYYLNVDNNRYKLAGADMLDYPKAFAQGTGEALGGAVDKLAAAGNVIRGAATGALGYAADKVGLDNVGKSLNEESNKAFSDAKEEWNDGVVKHELSKPFETGLSHESSIKNLERAGNFVGSIPEFVLGGRFIKGATTLAGVSHLPMINKLNKFMQLPANPKNKEFWKAASLFGLSGYGSELARSRDPNTPSTVNLIRELLGGFAAGSVIPSANKRALKSIVNSLSEAKLFQGGIRAGVLKGIAGSENIDVKAFKAFEKLNITEITPDFINKNSKMISWLAQKRANMSEKIIKNVDKTTFNFIESQLDKKLGKYIGSNATTGDSAVKRSSENFTDNLSKYLEELEIRKKELYDESLTFLKDANINTSNVVNQINEILPKVSTRVKSSDKNGMKEVSEILTDFKQNLLSKENNLNMTDISMLNNDKTAFKDLLLNSNTKRYNKFYSKIIEEIDKSIISSGNREYLDKRAIADKYYKEMIVPIIKTDIGKSLLYKEVPKSAYNLTNNAANINSLKAMMPKNPESEKLINNLLRVRVENILMDKVFKNDTFNSKAFIDMFNTKNKDDYLSALLGKSYYEIKDNILPIAQALERTNKNILNPSGTAESLALFGLSASTVAGLFNVSPTIIGTSFAAYLAPNYLAKAFFKPNVTKKLATYANKNKDREFTNLLKSGEKSFKDSVKNYLKERAGSLESRGNIVANITSDVENNN